MHILDGRRVSPRPKAETRYEHEPEMMITINHSQRRACVVLASVNLHLHVFTPL